LLRLFAHSTKLALVLLACNIFWSCVDDKQKHTLLFQPIDPDSAGFHFTNRIQETAQANILTYQYFYNGGGIAVGDLNNDGLEDLYLTANQGQNKLFLNLGDLKFRDITLATGTGGREHGWSTGAVIVDINGDGLKDIYVCYSGDLPEDMRKNQLFVNQGLDQQGIPFFKEMASAYGLDDPAFSTSAYFSDLDRDGDLDMLLLNHNPALFNNLNTNAFKSMLSTPDVMSSSKVYQNEGRKFVDVSAKVGIAGGTLSYGLGASIADFNQDGWPDIYIGNDYSAPDYFYINQGDGTFKNQLHSTFSHTSLYSMGVDAADINRDGSLDLITLDMLPEDSKRQKLLHSPENYEHYDMFLEAGLHHQLMRNMLQMNNGDGTFSEIGQAAGIATTDWSWAPLFADLDNDGLQDLFVSNGFLKDFTNLDFINYRQQVLGGSSVGQQQILELIASMPATKLSNYAFKNLNGAAFRNNAVEWGLDQPGNSNGAVYADLDGDGDLELIVNNLNEPSVIYKNLSVESGIGNFVQFQLVGEKGNMSGIGAKIRVYADGIVQFQQQQVYRGFQGNVSEILHFGLEKLMVDSVHIQWPNGAEQILKGQEANRRLVLKIEDAENKVAADLPQAELFNVVRHTNFPPLSQRFNDFKRQSQLLYGLSHVAPRLGSGDLDGDGLADLLLSDPSGSILMVKGGDPNAEAVEVAANLGSISAILCMDVDGDGNLDVYVGRGGYEDFTADDPLLQDVVLLNKGQDRFELSTSSFLPGVRASTALAISWDWDGDGISEIFVGGGYTPGRWPESAGSYLLIKGEEGYTMKDDDVLTAVQRVRDAVVYDLDGDGLDELIVAAEFDHIQVFSGKGGELKEVTSDYLADRKTGLWRSLLVEDLDGDGIPELLAGNWGLNSRLSTTAEIPLRVYFADFDKNGSLDPLMTFPIQGREVPFLSRDELAAQMYRKKALFTTHESFSEAGITDILSSEEISEAVVLQAETLETQLFTLKNGKFDAIPLPREVQYAPVNSAISLRDDVGKKELLLLGNVENSRLKLGPITANHGLLLKMNPTHLSWQAVPQSRSGLKLLGEVTSVVNVGDLTWVGARNQGISFVRRAGL
jgi:hypothetical protein